MGYARQVYTQAENELNRRRTTAQDNAQRRLENFYAVCPEAEDVRRRIASTASRAAMAVLRSGNARETMEALKMKIFRCKSSLPISSPRTVSPALTSSRSTPASAAKIPAM